MTPSAMAELLSRAMTVWAASAEELGALDREAGDGDLGVTIERGALAVRECLASMPPVPSSAEVVAKAGDAFSEANPSTFSMLVGGAVGHAARHLGENASWNDLPAFVGAIGVDIARRGQARVGDKTILDVLVPMHTVLTSQEVATLTAAQLVGYAEHAAEATAGLLPRKGRAAWIGERVRDRPDAGAVALARLARALADAYENLLYSYFEKTSAIASPGEA